MQYAKTPVVATPSDFSYIAVVSEQSGGSLWLDVATNTPIDIRGDDVIQLTIAVSSDRDAPIRLIIGGPISRGISTCVGNGAHVTDSAWADRSTISPLDADSLMKYWRHRPSTGTLFGYERTYSESDASAQKWLDGQQFLTTNVVPAVPDSKQFDGDSDGVKSIDVKSATLQCSIDRTSIVANNKYVSAIREPDLVATAAEQAGEGPIQISYSTSVQFKQQMRRISNTFPDAAEHVQQDGVTRLVTYSGNWWIRNQAGSTGTAITGPVVTVEPTDRQNWRTYSRLLAGFFASVTIAILTLLVTAIVKRIEGDSAAQAP
ncbi:hypothetical protein [Cellulomonas sp. URHE0023]|uniref:hypothetical protein n=1 Tax=Cellulomonas sp. URHE0023 TaxID=1380354 RepID=UPI0012DBCEC4|nr:hypothetical protein [Cellulomonas sp. URHE0023]